MPVSGMTIAPSAISSHHEGQDHETVTYRQKYKKLKQLVKETVFVSYFEHFCSVSWYLHLHDSFTALVCLLLTMQVSFFFTTIFMTFFLVYFVY